MSDEKIDASFPLLNNGNSSTKDYYAISIRAASSNIREGPRTFHEFFYVNIRLANILSTIESKRRLILLENQVLDDFIVSNLKETCATKDAEIFSYDENSSKVLHESMYSGLQNVSRRSLLISQNRSRMISCEDSRSSCLRIKSIFPFWCRHRRRIHIGEDKDD